jgi:hypothetical protein
MKKKDFDIEHEFVEFVPKVREERKVYVSIEYKTAVHNCFCGCGQKVVTPISPTGWQMTFDGDSVSLHPSVGNWSFPCRSHYWIKRNKVVWAGDMSQDDIDNGRANDRALREAYFGSSKQASTQVGGKKGSPNKRRFWSWVTGRR